MFPWTLFLLSLSFVLSYSILFSVLFTLGLCCCLIPLCIFFLIVILFECWKNCKTQSIPTHFKKKAGQRLNLSKEFKNSIFSTPFWRKGRATARFVKKNLKLNLFQPILKIRQGKGPFCQKNLKTQCIPPNFENKAGQRPILSKESKTQSFPPNFEKKGKAKAHFVKRI